MALISSERLYTGRIVSLDADTVRRVFNAHATEIRQRSEAVGRAHNHVRDALDGARPDRDAVGEPGRRARVLGRRDAEARVQRHAGDGADSLDKAREFGAQGIGKTSPSLCSLTPLLTHSDG